MQTCYNCGKQVSDETLICPECGALVRRYNTPPQPEVVPTAAVECCPVCGTPYVENGIFCTSCGTPRNQRIKFGFGVRLWLILLSIATAYLTFSGICACLLTKMPELFDAALSQPGMEVYTAQLEELAGYLPMLFPFFLAMTVTFALKFICHLWLLIRPRKLAFYASIGVSLAALLAFLILGGSLLSVLLVLDPLFTWLGLRHCWRGMK